MQIDTRIRVGANLKTIRTTRKLFQSDVAKVTGISRSLYTHYELGSRAQDAEILYYISQYFGVEMSILFESDHHKFLSELANNSTCDSELLSLISLYNQLSPFYKGMLIERAFALLEREKESEERQLSLRDRIVR